MEHLCSSAARITGKQPRPCDLGYSDFKVLSRAISQLSSMDRGKLVNFATAAAPPRNEDRRTHVFSLERPVKHEDKDIIAFRMKGVFPATKGKEGHVLPYMRGDGFVNRLMGSPSPGVLTIRSSRESLEYSAHGTLSYPRLTKEVLTALILGSEITDPLLGFGIFKGFSFFGVPVGFAVYGIESHKPHGFYKYPDTRIWDYMNQFSDRYGRLPDSASSSFGCGSLLRKAHEKKLTLTYPNLMNFRYVDDTHAKLVDLDTSKDHSALSKRDRENIMPALIYLDLYESMKAYYRSPFVKGSVIDFRQLAGGFISGYFAGCGSAGDLASIATAGRRDDPTFHPFFHPIGKLRDYNDEGSVDLNGFADKWEFSLLYDSIKDIVSGLKY